MCFFSTTVSQCAKWQVIPHRSQNSQSSACQIVSSNSPTSSINERRNKAQPVVVTAVHQKFALAGTGGLPTAHAKAMQAGLLAASEQDIAVNDAGFGLFRRRGRLPGHAGAIRRPDREKEASRLGRLAPAVFRLAERPPFFWRRDALNASADFAAATPGSRIGAAVIADDYFLRRVSLTQNAFDGAGERGGAVVCGNDNADWHPAARNLSIAFNVWLVNHTIVVGLDERDGRLAPSARRRIRIRAKRNQDLRVSREPHRKRCIPRRP